MVTISYFGYMNVFTVNSDGSLTRIHTQSLLGVVKNGVYCADVDSSRNYLILGSFVSNTRTKANAQSSFSGLYLWRILNAEPWVKHVSLNDDNNKSDQVATATGIKNLSKMNYSKIVSQVRCEFLTVISLKDIIV